MGFTSDNFLISVFNDVNFGKIQIQLSFYLLYYYKCGFIISWRFLNPKAFLVLTLLVSISAVLCLAPALRLADVESDPDGGARQQRLHDAAFVLTEAGTSVVHLILLALKRGNWKTNKTFVMYSQ